MMKKISALKARQNLGGLLEAVRQRGDRFIIERAGRPMAAVVPLWELEEWRTQRENFFGAIEEVWKRNTSVPAETIQSEVSEAVKGARRKSKRR